MPGAARSDHYYSVTIVALVHNSFVFVSLIRYYSEITLNVSSLFAFLLLVRAAATGNDDPGDDCMRVFISGEGLALGPAKPFFRLFRWLLFGYSRTWRSGYWMCQSGGNERGRVFLSRSNTRYSLEAQFEFVFGWQYTDRHIVGQHYCSAQRHFFLKLSHIFKLLGSGQRRCMNFHLLPTLAMKTRPSNEEVKEQARKANEHALIDEISRQQGPHQFDDLELDQALNSDNIDQSNWSWTESGSEQYQLVLADDSMLPDLPEETPSPTYDESNQIGLVDDDFVDESYTASAISGVDR